ncbi:glycosyltransferase [Zunongwangia profunda]|nr:glycosyltransferase [Zunongwangia profunda]
MPRKRILMVAMPSLHFYRWVQQLENSNFEVSWFDITGSGGSIERIDWVHQITEWKLRWDFPGRIFIKSKFSRLYNIIGRLNERSVTSEFEKVLKTFKPDIVHSFALYVSCSPILSVMRRHNGLKWVYSSWGSDLYYYQNVPEYLKDIQLVLSRIDYLFTDCKRDLKIAKSHGFKGEFLGVFPGGGGFKLEELTKYKEKQENRDSILIKGYQGRSGRAIPVLQAILELQEELKEFKIIVFGADPEVVEYSKKSNLMSWGNYEISEKISHIDVLKLMGKSKIYIGNSNSDGMPNTLLEAICMDVYPIQSNPGGVSEEIIKNYHNGLLIKNCDDSNDIKLLIKIGLKSSMFRSNKHIKENLSYDTVRKLCLEKYLKIYND